MIKEEVLYMERFSKTIRDLLYIADHTAHLIDVLSRITDLIINH